MRPGIAFLAFLLLVLCAPGASPDSWESFDVHRYVSDDGAHELWVEEEPLHARLYAVGEPCRRIAEFRMPVLPRWLFLAGDGRRVVVVDTYYSNDADSPGFLLLDAQGVELARHAIRDLVDLDKTKGSVSSIWWFDPEQSGFAAGGKVFVLATKTGERRAFDVEKGAPVTPAPEAVQPAAPAEDASVTAEFLRQFECEPAARSLVDALVAPIEVRPALAAHRLRGHPAETTTARLSGALRSGELAIGMDCALKAEQGRLVLEFDHHAWEIAAARVATAVEAWKKGGTGVSQVSLADNGYGRARLRVTHGAWVFDVDAQLDARTPDLAAKPTLADVGLLLEGLEEANALPATPPAGAPPLMSCYGESLYVSIPDAGGVQSTVWTYDLATGKLKR